MAEREPARVAIIGGGCAAIAAAFELTRPELEARFAVTVYQQGFRFFNLGYASAAAYTVFVAVMVLAIVQIRFLRSTT